MDSEERKRIRCPQMQCRTVQFVNATKTCVKCKQPFTQQIAKVAELSACPELIPDKPKPSRFDDDTPVDGQVFDLAFWLGFVFWDIRRQKGISQLELAARMKCPRQWLFKVEHGTTVPLMSKGFPRLCEALDVSPAHVVRMTEFLTFGA